ncbi:MAG: DUF465 domain-containing protein [Methylotenera sp.]|uniref:YdcH family protein n=1 Tax=Methylotenera sp. TaxID=2051956 RepID=UPI0017C82EFB|nr:DUF465 domain-containing protein [Methylotenera sp.]NOU24302.1 DUF465 domain-containing protein [Methylotenera sp.]
MSIEHHDLVHEFPEHREKIHSLKISNAHFAKLFDEYHLATKGVEHLEGIDVPVSDVDFENHKKKRALLKDQLYSMLVS